MKRTVKRAQLLIASDSGATATLTAVRPDGSISALYPMIQWSIDVARVVAAELGIETIAMTSGPDGRHSRTSLHYPGCAWDLRTHGRREGSLKVTERRRFIPLLRERLGPDFDVVQEKHHAHIEYQPKGPGEMPT